MSNLLVHAQNHAPACPCCAPSPARLGRRTFLRGAAAGAAVLALAPRLGWAAEGNYEAMILACIDPRIQEPVHAFAQKNGLVGKYSQFVIAGAAIGVVSPKFADWHKAFWDNLATSVQLHNIKTVIAIDHRDCGAYKLVLGEDFALNPARETQVHTQWLHALRDWVGSKHPDLKVELFLMALDGTVEEIH
jgi:hypothetical protein